MNTAESSQASLAQERAAVQQRIEAQQQKLQSLTDEYRRQCEEIANTLRELQAQSNALAPVSRLAPELLSHIFLTHAATFHDNPKRRHRRRSLGWLSLLGVCRHWRQVAMATPPLWAHLLLAEKDYVEVALQRSGNTPLHLRPPALYPEHLEDVYLAVQGEISRIRTLELIVRNEAVRSLQKLDLTAVYAGMPMLEELQLVFSLNYQYDISPALALLKMPRLRSLEIADGPFSFTSSLARRTITRLEVSFRDPVALNSLLDVLDGMPLLQHLELHNLHKQLPRVPNIDPRTVRLQHLAYLHLDGKAWSFDLPCLLQSLAFPEGTRISFNPEYQPIQQDTVNFEQRQFLLPILFSRGFFSDIPGRSPSGRCRPRVLALRTNDFQLRLWGPSTSLHDLDNKAYLQQVPHLDVKLGIRCELPESNPSFLGLLDLSALSVLDISPRAMSCDFWITTFRNHIPPNLERLYLSDTNLDNCGTLFEALGNLMIADARPTVDEDYDNGHAALSKRYILPGLQTIRLDGISTNYIRSRDVLRDLIAILHRRAKAGSKLKTLIVNYRGNFNAHGAQDYATLHDPFIYLMAEAVEISEYLAA